MDYGNQNELEMAKETTLSLIKKGYEAFYVDTKAEARQFVLDSIPAGSTVGMGGSMTIRELEIHQELSNRDCKILDHWQKGLSTEEILAIRKEQMRCNFFLTSANAVTQSGEIINIDGMGNRVSATVFGPGEVIMVIGLNKIAGDLAAGLIRSKEVAAVLNAKRLGRKTPCVQTGICTDCDSPERICNVSVILHRRPREKSGFGGGFKIIVVGESLGF